MCAESTGISTVAVDKVAEVRKMTDFSRLQFVHVTEERF